MRRALVGLALALVMVPSAGVAQSPQPSASTNPSLAPAVAANFCVTLELPADVAMSFGDIFRGLLSGAITIVALDDPATCRDQPVSGPSASIAPGDGPTASAAPTFAQLRKRAISPTYMELHRNRGRYVDRPLYLVAKVSAVIDGAEVGHYLVVTFEGIGPGPFGGAAIAGVDWPGTPVPKAGQRIAMIAHVNPRDLNVVRSLDELSFRADAVRLLPGKR